MGPPPASAPRCAARSIPNAAPETTGLPASTSVWPMSVASWSPYVVAARDPTTATELAEGVQPDRALGPQADRDAAPVVEWLRVGQVVELTRPLPVSRDHEPDTESGGSGQLRLRLARGQAVSDVGEDPRQAVTPSEPGQQVDRAESGHQLGDPGVAGLA